MNQEDLELRQYLKNWADRQPLPVGGRVRLIAAAASIRDRRRKKTPPPSPSKTDDLISWAMVYNVNRQSLAKIIT